MVETLTKEAEINVKQHLQEGAKQMAQMKQMKKENKNSMCNNCNKNPIIQNGLCQECYFSQKIQKGQEEFSG
jgi:hypothetical protein